MPNSEIRVRKGDLISKQYIESEKQQAIVLLKFRFPKREIEIEETDKEIILKAVERQKEDNSTKNSKLYINKGFFISVVNKNFKMLNVSFIIYS